MASDTETVVSIWKGGLVKEPLTSQHYNKTSKMHRLRIHITKNLLDWT